MMLVRTSPLVGVILAAALASTSVARAQESSGATSSTGATSSSPATAEKPGNTLVTGFTDLAGSRENASSLVHGLRTGSAITLTYPAGTTPIVASTTFTPGTRPMGYGNIRIALSLARVQLAKQGIVNPTPEQLRGALIGPSGTTAGASPGILQMRAAGMGWGQIAHATGVKLGAVMSGKPSVAAASTTPTTAGGSSRTVSAGLAAGNGSHGKSGITSAAGSFGSSGRGVITGLGGGGSGGGHAANIAVHASGGRAGGGAPVSHAGGLGRGKP